MTSANLILIHKTAFIYFAKKMFNWKAYWGLPNSSSAVVLGNSTVVIFNTCTVYSNFNEKGNKIIQLLH